MQTQSDHRQTKPQKRRPPRQPHTQPYTSVNSYNQHLSKQFVITVAVFLTQLILHCVFIPRAIIAIDNALLYVMWGLGYILIMVIGYDYTVITCFDPADRILLDGNFLNKYMEQQLRQCDICVKKVHKNSYHCNRCNRCTQNFDHHCIYLNNCIGSQNYQSFLRIVLVDIGYNLIIIGQSIWVFIRASNEMRIDQSSFSRWGVLTLIIFSCLILLVVMPLFGFHVYLNCCQNITTLEFIQRDSYEYRKNQIQKQPSRAFETSQHHINGNRN